MSLAVGRLRWGTNERKTIGCLGNWRWTGVRCFPQVVLVVLCEFRAESDQSEVAGQNDRVHGSDPQSSESQRVTSRGWL